MAYEFVARRQLAFHETDMAGIAHFSNFFRWMEETEHAFLKSLGAEPVRQDGLTFWGWPRGRASCDFHAPLRFGDAFEVHLLVREIKLKSVLYQFRFRKLLPGGGTEPVARGEMASVYASFDVQTQAMRALGLEEALLSRLEAAPESALRAAKEGSSEAV